MCRPVECCSDETKSDSRLNFAFAVIYLIYPDGNTRSFNVLPRSINNAADSALNRTISINSFIRKDTK